MADYSPIEDPEASPSSENEDSVKRMSAPIEYDPRSWKDTLLVLRGRPFISGDIEGGRRTPLYIVWALGTGAVVLSALVGATLEENDRKCRAWCSRFSLGPQPHAYVGVVLFLLMAFRTNEAYRSYQAGLSAWTKMRELLLNFVTTMLHMTPREAIPREARRRMIAFCIALPYALHADLCEARDFDFSPIENFMQRHDINKMKHASSMPLYLIECLLVMIRKTVPDETAAFIKKTLSKSILELHRSFAEAERVKSNPVAFAYVSHLRLLLMVYLLSMPLALVESLGWSTIPVFITISYGLMGLEMMAVEVENPYGTGGSDLRLDSFNAELADMIHQAWRRWEAGLEYEQVCDSYAAGFGKRRILDSYRYW